MKYLLKEIIDLLLEKAVSNGTIKLFHYSTSDAPALILDPKRFASNSFTKRDLMASGVPRVFFYTDPTQKEDFFLGGHFLYSATVKASEVYDLRVDPLKLKKNFVDIDEILHELIRIKYKGVMYTTGGREVVVWFEPIKVRKIATSSS